MLPWRFPQLPVSRIALAVIQGPMFDRSIRTTKASGSSVEFEIRGNWSRLFPSPVVASRLLTKVGGKEDAVWGSIFFSRGESTISRTVRVWLAIMPDQSEAGMAGLPESSPACQSVRGRLCCGGCPKSFPCWKPGKRGLLHIQIIRLE